MKRAALAACLAASALGHENAAAGVLLHYEVSGQLQRQTTEFVPAGVDAFLQSQFDGQAVQLSFDLDPAAADIDPAAASADYRGAVVASTLRIAGIDMQQLAYCAGTATLDCSVKLRNDSADFGGLFDDYQLRSRNFQVAAGSPLDGLVHLLSFLFNSGEFSAGGVPALLDSTALDPGLQALIGGHPQDLSINLQQSGGCRQCLFASWGISDLQISGPGDAVTAVPEPSGAPITAAALLALAAVMRFRRRV